MAGWSLGCWGLETPLNKQDFSLQFIHVDDSGSYAPEHPISTSEDAGSVFPGRWTDETAEQATYLAPLTWNMSADTRQST